MKLLLVLMVCAVATAAPNVHKVEHLQEAELEDNSAQFTNILVNAMVRQLFTYLRHVINNGSALFGIPPLDPLDLDHFHLVIPAGLINLDLELKDIHVSGAGDFVVHSSNLNLGDMTFYVDISVPVLNIRAGEYDLLGDLYTAIPLYGKGKANFVVDGFRFQASLILKQSEDQKSVLVDRVEEPSFTIPSFKSDLTGVIGGGDIDLVVNAVVEEVIFDYINRFRGAVSLIVAARAPGVLNPLLGSLDTWKYLAPLIPRA